jgi:hypothetical protein
MMAASNKDYRFGGKQMNGNSRKSYFAMARIRQSANKARRIAKNDRKMLNDSVKFLTKEEGGRGATPRGWARWKRRSLGISQ